MDEKRINSLIENIEIFLEASAKNNEQVLAEIQSLKNDPKAAQILNEAASKVNVSVKEIIGLISAEKQLIENFKPEVEVKHLHVDVKNPLYWILGAVAAIIISVFVCSWFYRSKQEIIKSRDYYKSQSDGKDWYYMEFKYLLLFGEQPIVDYLKGFDSDYRKDYKTFDDRTNERLKQLEEAAKARELANIKANEAKQLRHRADSLNNAK